MTDISDKLNDVEIRRAKVEAFKDKINDGKNCHYYRNICKNKTDDCKVDYFYKGCGYYKSHILLDMAENEPQLLKKDDYVTDWWAS